MDYRRVINHSVRMVEEQMVRHRQMTLGQGPPSAKNDFEFEQRCCKRPCWVYFRLFRIRHRAFPLAEGGEPGVGYASTRYSTEGEQAERRTGTSADSMCAYNCSRGPDARTVP